MSRPLMAAFVVLAAVAVSFVMGLWVPLEFSIVLGLVIGVLGGLAASYVMGWRH